MPGMAAYCVPEISAQSRWMRIFESAGAVHLKGVALALSCSAKGSILLAGSLKLENEPRRMAIRVIMPNRRSTWLSHT